MYICTYVYGHTHTPHELPLLLCLNTKCNVYLLLYLRGTPIHPHPATGACFTASRRCSKSKSSSHGTSRPKAKGAPLPREAPSARGGGAVGLGSCLRFFTGKPVWGCFALRGSVLRAFCWACAYLKTQILGLWRGLRTKWGRFGAMDSFGQLCAALWAEIWVAPPSRRRLDGGMVLQGNQKNPTQYWPDPKSRNPRGSQSGAMKVTANPVVQCRKATSL